MPKKLSSASPKATRKPVLTPGIHTHYSPEDGKVLRRFSVNEQG